MLKHFLDFDMLGRRPYMRLFLIFVLIVIITIVLGILLVIGIEKYPELVGFGCVSFAVCAVIVGIICSVWVIIWNWHTRKKHPCLWKQLSDKSLEKRYMARAQIRSLKEPRLNRIGKVLNRLGFICFFIWLILFIIVSYVVMSKGR